MLRLENRILLPELMNGGRRATGLPSLFLCHASSDKALVRRLAVDLEWLGVDVWFDEWELGPGDGLHECIGSALEKASFIGAVISQQSKKSKWCKRELEQGLARELRRGRTLIIPLLAESIAAPPFLADRMYLDLQANYLHEITRLVSHIWGISRRIVGMSLAQAELRSTADVARILAECATRAPRRIILSPEQYRHLAELFGKLGLEVDSRSFSVRSAIGYAHVYDGPPEGVDWDTAGSPKTLPRRKVRKRKGE